MRKLAIALFLAFAFSLLISCQSKEKNLQSTLSNASTPSLTRVESSPPASPTPDDNSLKGFLYINSNQSEQIFINWTNQENLLNGSMQYASTKKSGNEIAIETNSYPFTGVISKKSISLNFTNGFFNSTITITGAIRKNELILYFPDNDGLLNEFSFKESSVQEYNSLIQSLSEKIKNTNRQQAELKAIEEQEAANKRKKENEQKAVIQANQSLENVIQTLLEQLKNRENFEEQFTNVNTSFETHWKQMNLNKQKLIAASKVKPFNNDQYYIVQDIRYDIGDDKYAIGDDTYQFKDIEWRINNYLADLQSSLDDINHRWSLLNVATKQNSTGTPLPNFTEEHILTLTKNIEVELNKSTSLLATNQKISAQFQDKAEKLADEMLDYFNNLQIEYD
ncbi:hypothetical protein [Paenibacillus sp. NPDC058174]|uniref:hypothetical protein n=1 Tax=Paenibacillus sp. NPDC058174 TaxID=3346366 RepID=UPI0036DF1994